MLKCLKSLAFVSLFLGSHILPSAACRWLATNHVHSAFYKFKLIFWNLTTLMDLRIQTPLTYVETYFSVESDCSTNPFTFTETRTAFLNGTSYTADIVTITISSVTFVTYTFPDLLLNFLTPGEVITQVISTCIRLMING